VTRPLEGWRIVASVAGEPGVIVDGLRAAGAHVAVARLVSIAPTSSPSSLAAAVRGLAAGDYAWLAVTSRAAVAALAAAADALGVSLAGAPVRVAAVGASTARAAEAAGLDVALMPATGGTASDLAAHMPAGEGRVLAALGNLAGSALADGLQARGWTVDVVQAYRTVEGPPLDQGLRWDVREGAVDAVVLTSGSAAARFAAEFPALPATLVVVAIGSTTAREAVAAGLTVAATAQQPTPEGVVAALESIRRDVP